MECGQRYDKEEAHGRKYLESLLDKLTDTPKSVVTMLS